MEKKTKYELILDTISTVALVLLTGMTAWFLWSIMPMLIIFD